MANSIGIQIKGTKEMAAALAALVSAFPMSVADALEAEAEIEMTEAKRRTPVATGALKSSGHVQPAKVLQGLTGNDVSVTLGFGGPAAPYALAVHEDLEAFHRVGEAKFLESTLRESAPYMAERIANRVKAKMGL